MLPVSGLLSSETFTNILEIVPNCVDEVSANSQSS